MNTTNLSIKIYAVLSSLILLGLAACGITEAGVAAPIPTQTGAVEETDASGIGTIEIGIEPTPMPEALTYTNETYGFKFVYPETWTLTEEDHGVVLKKDANRLGINFRWADEDLPSHFGRTGMGAGDFVYAGKIHFMGQVIPAEALLFEKKFKAVVYGETGLVEIDDLVFMIVLEDLETDYADVELPEEIITQAKTILESFARTGATAETGATSETSPLEAYLEVQNSAQIGSDEPVNLHFLLKNHSDEALYLLKWYTPFEGIAGNIFEVTHNGQSSPYQGILATRANPTPESYLLLESGQSLETEINIATVYDFSQPGTYMIKFRSPRISHIARSEEGMAKTMDELGPIDIPSNAVSVERAGSSQGIRPPVRRTTDEAREMITAYLRDQKSDLAEDLTLTIEEIPIESAWEQLQVQIFRVSEGIFLNESFLIRDDRVLQLGTAVGGQGLASLAVLDLDQDGRAELLFTYGFGSDLHQSRMATSPSIIETKRPLWS